MNEKAIIGSFVLCIYSLDKTNENCPNLLHREKVHRIGQQTSEGTSAPCQAGLTA